MYIKILLLLIIISIVYRLYSRWRKQDLNNVQFCSWLLVWLIAVLIIIFPQITSRLAELLGVGRGVDLAIYLSVIVLFYLVFRLLVRIEDLDKNLTKLTRQIALKENENEKSQ